MLRCLAIVEIRLRPQSTAWRVLVRHIPPTMMPPSAAASSSRRAHSSAVPVLGPERTTQSHLDESAPLRRRLRAECGIAPFRAMVDQPPLASEIAPESQPPPLGGFVALKVRMVAAVRHPVLLQPLEKLFWNLFQPVARALDL